MSWDVSKLIQFEYENIPEEYSEIVNDKTYMLMQHMIITDHFLKRMEPVDGEKGYYHGLTRSMMSEIARCIKNCESTFELSYRVLSFIQYRSEECFREFVHCLIETNQAELAAFLDHAYVVKQAPLILKTMRTVDFTPHEERPIELPENWPTNEQVNLEFPKVPFDLLKRHAIGKTYLFRGSGFFRGRCLIFNLYKNEIEQQAAEKDLKSMQELYSAIGYYCITVSTSMEKYKQGLSSEKIKDIVDFIANTSFTNCPSFMLIVMSKGSEVERNEKGELKDYLIHTEDDSTVKASELMTIVQEAKNLKNAAKVFAFHGTVNENELQAQENPGEPMEIEYNEKDDDDKKKQAPKDIADTFVSIALCEENYFKEKSLFFQAMKDVYLWASHNRPWFQLQYMIECLLNRLNENKLVYNFNYRMQDESKLFYFFPNVNLQKFYMNVPIPDSRATSRRKYY